MAQYGKQQQRMQQQRDAKREQAAQRMARSDGYSSAMQTASEKMKSSRSCWY
jgi:hypothetical protein